MTRVIMMASHDSAFDRQLEATVRCASGELTDGGVHLGAYSATGEAILAELERHASDILCFFVNAVELADNIDLQNLHEQVVARGDTLEVHGFVLPVLEQAIHDWEEKVCQGKTNRDFTSWLATEFRLAWPTLVGRVEKYGGSLWPVDVSTSPAACLLRILDLTPLLRAQIRTAEEAMKPFLARQLMGWEIELCRTWNSQGRATLARNLRKMSPTGSPYAPSEEDVSVLLDRFGAEIERLNAARLKGGGVAELAGQETLHLVANVRRPLGNHPLIPPTLSALNEDDRMNRAVLAILLMGATL